MSSPIADFVSIRMSSPIEHFLAMVLPLLLPVHKLPLRLSGVT